MPVNHCLRLRVLVPVVADRHDDRNPGARNIQVLEHHVEKSQARRQEGHEDRQFRNGWRRKPLSPIDVSNRYANRRLRRRGLGGLVGLACDLGEESFEHDVNASCVVRFRTRTLLINSGRFTPCSLIC